MRHSDGLSRSSGRDLSRARRVRGVVLSLSFAVGVTGVWWAGDPRSEPDSRPSAGPLVEVGPARAARAPGSGGLPSQGTELAHFGAASKTSPTPASAERPPSHYSAERLASPDAGEFDPENPAHLEAAGRRAWTIGRLEDAAEFFQRALANRELRLGPDDPSVAHTLRLLGGVYADQHRYVDAEAAYQRAIVINEGGGSRSVLAAAVLYDLALLHRSQGRSMEALPLLEAALDIELDLWGPQHPNVAARLAALGLLHRQQGHYDEAEPYLEQSLLVREQIYRRDHPETTGALTSLAQLYRQQKRYAEAEDLFRRALEVHEGMSDQPRVAMDLANLSVLYLSDAQFAQAQPVFERALRIEDENQWSVTPQVSVGLDQLARVADAEGRQDEAEEIYEWAFDASQRVLGSESANTAFLRNQYIQYLRSLGRDEDADRLEKS